MAYTANEVISMAKYRNIRNKDDLISKPEAVDILDQEQRRLFIIAAGDNPEYFGQVWTSPARTGPSDAWAISGIRAAAIDRCYVNTIVGTISGMAAGDEIFLVDSRFPELMPSPRAYIRNFVLYGQGLELGDGANYVSKVNIYYSPFPSAMTDENSYITLPDQFISLLVIRLAAVWALRDGGRDAEYGQLGTEYTDELALFRQAVKIYGAGATRPPAQISVWQLEAGGGNAQS